MHIMLDLETMGTGTNASIIQIGAVRFDPHSREKSGKTFEINVDLLDCILLGLDIDQPTIEWWRNQPNAHLVSGSSHKLGDALRNFLQWVGHEKIEGIWSHGATFDIPILENALKLTGLPTPWKYAQYRDTRTVFWLARYERNRKVLHCAVLDAMEQVEDLQKAMEELCV